MGATTTTSTLIRRSRWLGALWRASIWHPDAIPVYEGQAALELKRYVLPAFDAILVVMGIMAVAMGMPSFDILYNDLLSTVAAWTLLVSAITAGVGLAFPRLWKLEAIGKIAMTAVIAGYSTALWVLVVRGEDGRGFVACATTALLLLPIWNLRRIGRERQARMAREESKKQ